MIRTIPCCGDKEGAEGEHDSGVALSVWHLHFALKDACEHWQCRPANLVFMPGMHSMLRPENLAKLLRVLKRDLVEVFTGEPGNQVLMPQNFSLKPNEPQGLLQIATRVVQLPFAPEGDPQYLEIFSMVMSIFDELGQRIMRGVRQTPISEKMFSAKGRSPTDLLRNSPYLHFSVDLFRTCQAAWKAFHEASPWEVSSERSSIPGGEPRSNYRQL